VLWDDTVYTYSYYAAINDAGQVLQVAVPQGGQTYDFTLLDLATGSSLATATVDSFADVVMNASGQVAFPGFVAGSYGQYFLSAATGLLPLPGLPGGNAYRSSGIYDVNEAGQFVGHSAASASTFRAVLWAPAPANRAPVLEALTTPQAGAVGIPVTFTAAATTRFVFQLTSPDGEAHSFDARIVPELNDKRQVVSVLAIARDISESRKAEEKLEHERELLQAIIDSIPVMLTIYDPPMKRFTVNKFFRETTGWTQKDALQDLASKTYPDPERRKEVLDFMQALTPNIPAGSPFISAQSFISMPLCAVCCQSSGICAKFSSTFIS
jgi:PAS domain-containing protein